MNWAEELKAKVVKESAVSLKTWAHLGHISPLTDATTRGLTRDDFRFQIVDLRFTRVGLHSVRGHPRHYSSPRPSVLINQQLTNVSDSRHISPQSPNTRSIFCVPSHLTNSFTSPLALATSRLVLVTNFLEELKAKAGSARPTIRGIQH